MRTEIVGQADASAILQRYALVAGGAAGAYMPGSALAQLLAAGRGAAAGADPMSTLAACSPGMHGLQGPGPGHEVAQAVIQALATKVVGDGTIVREQAPTRTRRWALGFNSLAVPAGATIAVTAFPQVVFRGERLVIPSTVAPNFDVQAISVGKDPQFPAVGATPGLVYEQGAFGVDLGLDTAEPGVTITLSVTNVTAVAADFRAALIGTSLY